jgi:uncharacterized protein (TIGR02646 family)
MRPVDRGDAPQQYAAYQNAIEDLENRLGRYCSYCERRLPTGLAVEHVSPKSLDPARKTDWKNFLLACANCNTVKGTKVTNDADFLWPDKDNTLLGIEYQSGGLVQAHIGLSDAVKAKAQNLIDLVGLDRHPGQPEGKKPANRDKRHGDREEAWTLANLKRERLEQNDSQDFRDMLIELAEATGFFGVWMNVFHNDEDIRQRLIATFIGVAAECFDADGNSVARPGGHI